MKDLSPTASLENELSVWLTEDSLVRMLHDVGFSGTEKVVYPRDGGTWWSDLRKECRVLMVASSSRNRSGQSCSRIRDVGQWPSLARFRVDGVHNPTGIGPFHGLQHCDRE